VLDWNLEKERERDWTGTQREGERDWTGPREGERGRERERETK
jgi:hypothetical protein